MTLSDTAFLIRARAATPMVRTLARDLSDVAPGRVWTVGAPGGGWGVTGVPHVALDESVVAGFGFRGYPEDWGWLCGDYAYYAALDAMPGHRFYCMVEEDVAFSGDGVRAFADLLDRLDHEAVAAGLGRFETPPKFSRGLEAVGGDPHAGCIFPVTRVARTLIPAMRDLRARVQAVDPAPRVNDEAILAGAALAEGTRLYDLYDAGDLVAPERFATNPPHLAEHVADAGGPAVFHPVLPLGTALWRIAGNGQPIGRHRARKLRKGARAHVLDAIDRALDQAESGGGGVVDPARASRVAELIGDLPEFAPVHVIDVGANPIEGEVSYAALLRLGQARVTGFEPNPVALADLEARASGAETYLPHALGDGGTRTLHLTRQSGFSSLYPPDRASVEYLGFGRGAAVVRTLEVETRRLDDLEGVAGAAFLKIDVQGAERDVIAHGRETLSRTLVIQTEVRFFPLYEDEPGFGALDTELRDQGFFLHGFDFLKRVPTGGAGRKTLRRRVHGQVVDGDAFYVRDLRGIGTWDASALAQLAVIADSVMDAPDLVLRCLEVLEERGLADGAEARYLASLPAALRR